MTATVESLGIDRMTIEERITLVQAIWDSIPAMPVISDALREELVRRAAEDEANPQTGIPWERVKAEALARIRT